MRPPLPITSVSFAPAPPDHVADGLLGWISLTFDGRLRLDGLALRRTRDGRRTITFPRRLDRSGRSHPVVLPLDDRTRHEIERQVLDALDAQGVAS